MKEPSIDIVYHTSLDHSTREHVQDALSRRAPNIKNICKKYDALQRKCEKIPRDRRPPGAIVPPKLDIDEASKLDIDSDIWFDIGLHNKDEFKDGVPDWLADEKTQLGIRAMHQVLNCEAELDRCHQERTTLQTWYIDEHAATVLAGQEVQGQCSMFVLSSNNLMGA